VRRRRDIERKTVEIITEEYLCNSCGACSLICPANAIQFKETVGGYLFPTIDWDRCMNCGLCIAVCPGVHFGETLTAKLPDDPFVGHTDHCFVGRAANDEVFRNSQSGGVVTALLLDALRVGHIDAALVTIMEVGPEPRPTALLAKTKEQVIAAQKSKYSPVALLEALKQAHDQDLKLGVVGLPCQLHGLYNICDLQPSLREKISFKIGLICDRIMSAAAIDYLIQAARLNEQVRMLLFRDKSAGGYPGSVRVLGDRGSDTVLPSSVRLEIKDVFTPPRCRLCFDKMNVFADVTVGDPWGVSGAHRSIGESAVVCRNEIGSRIVTRAIRRNTLMLRPIECGEVVEGQKIEQRRSSWRGYCNAWKALGLELPDYYADVIKNPSAEKNGRYRRQLDRSLSLDSFVSRRDLLRYARRSVLRQRIRQRLLLPYRLARQARRRVQRVIAGAIALLVRSKGDM
jgi:coenzyme F420 hydrogenase subunit beta